MFFPGESSYRTFFGDMMCFDCVGLLCFSVFVEVNFFVETDVIVQGQMNGIVCVCVYPATSSHI